MQLTPRGPWHAVREAMQVEIDWASFLALKSVDFMFTSSIFELSGVKTPCAG